MRAVALLVRVVLGVIAVGLAGVAFALNAWFWHEINHGQPALVQYGSAAASVCIGAAKLGIPVYMSYCAYRWLERPGIIVAFLAVFAFDIWTGFGYTALTRGTASAESDAQAMQWGELKAQQKDAEKKLRGIPEEPRPLGTLEAELAAARRLAPNCEKRANAKGEDCRTVSALEVAVANAKARVQLEADISEVRGKLAALPARKDAQPDITIIAKWFRALGATSPEPIVELVRSVLWLLLIDLVPPALLMLVCRTPPAAPLTLTAPKRGAAEASAARAAEAPAERKPASGGPRVAVGANVLELLQRAQPDSAGWIVTTQRAMGEALGISAAEVNRQIGELESRKIIERQSSRRGTRLKLISAPGSVVSLRPSA